MHKEFMPQLRVKNASYQGRDEGRPITQSLHERNGAGPDSLRRRQLPSNKDGLFRSSSSLYLGTAFSENVTATP